ncbi:MAG: TadE/TadG family type IV pilus assembly protein, partial [Rhizobiaceae bacterium]
MFTFKNLRSSVASFAKDRNGNFAVMFAIASIPVVMGVGIAIDFTRMLNAKTQMQDALDVALLSTAKDIAQGKIAPSDARGAVQNFFEVNLNAKRTDVASAKIV